MEEIGNNPKNSADVVMMFLDEESPKKKIDVMKQYGKLLDRTGVANIAASLDLTLESDDTGDGISRIMDQLRAEERFDGSRLRDGVKIDFR
ncbi:MAG: hypothetical protein VZR00_06530 [Lachnospiraceae bacterium]|nr:hypothetical protein [Lachnospiraceae bacterium]MEE3461532.1 hypothetical protein [Lachnospiraceae bacterium]